MSIFLQKILHILGLDQIDFSEIPNEEYAEQNSS